MKEPLVWFVLIGGLLFAADRYQGPAPIVIDEAVKTQIANLWQTQMGVSPTEKELDSLVHNWVREEIFFREALRLGLDSEDTIIRRRLVQKLGFIAQDVNEDTITADDVRRFYENKIDDYTLPRRYSLSQIYLSESHQAEPILAMLTTDNWREQGESSLLPRQLIKKSEREVTSTFGIEFARQLGDFIEGQWVGPVSSTFGYHLVRLNELTPVEVTPLAYVEKQVMTDLLHQRRQQSLDDYYTELLDQYDVEYR
ncbi:MAG: peptidyl-prolyl cis-trans isomerase [Gammaproteobacteria bacterium]|jgi:hypothetical protein|nr:peptidyl-prolyl cis-trans isomerase [Gammaproteobacteria bacterium]MBT4494472.1 peptidyl-prolyl cis-trans isomerase [Gammaproteobacteria bacterium]